MNVGVEKDKKTLGEYLSELIEDVVLEEREKFIYRHKDIKEFSKVRIDILPKVSYVEILIKFDFLKIPKHKRYILFSLERNILEALEEKFKNYEITALPQSEEDIELPIRPFEKGNINSFIKIKFLRG